MGDRIILDGGMGTMLQARGLKPGDHPEIYGMEHPEIVEEIHRKYIEAGSNVIYANTFEANGHKLKGTGHTPAEVITANIRTARRAAGDSVKVALDVGPIGELMEPLGTLTFEEAYQVYKEMVIAGEKAGADLVVFETQTDLQEVRAGVFAARENTDLPVWTTMSFEESGRTFSGTTVASMACTLDALGVDAMGVNCSLGPRQLIPIIEEMITWTDRPIIVKPNAGLPDPATGAYSIGPEEFAQQMRPYSELGVSIMGGCCGTDPEFIRNLSEVIPAPAERKGNKRHGVCAAGHMTELKGIRVIGERINPTGKKRFQQALREHDLDYIIERAIEQADAGADILDINVGLPGIDEPAMMREVVTAVQGMVSLPLQIDSSNIEAIEAGLRACNGRAIVNSVNGDEEKLKTILPIVHKYGAAVVGLTLDEDRDPEGRRPGGLPYTDHFGTAGAGGGDTEGHSPDPRPYGTALCTGRQQHLLRTSGADPCDGEFPGAGHDLRTGSSHRQSQSEGDHGCHCLLQGAVRGGSVLRKLYCTVLSGGGSTERSRHPVGNDH